MNFKDDEHLKFLIEHAPIGISILDAASFKIEMLNDKFLDIAGKPQDDLLGKWYWELLPKRGLTMKLQCLTL